MRTIPLLTAPALLLMLGAAPPQARDLEPLQGTWRAEAGPTGEVIVTLTIDGDRYTQVVETGPQHSFTFRGRLRIDPAAEPGRLDWLETVGPEGTPEPEALALYRLDGDVLTVCTGAPGAARPEAFEAGRGRFPSLRAFRRVVETAEEPLSGDLVALQGQWSGEVGPGGRIKASLSIRGRTSRFVLVGPEGQEILASTGRIRLDEAASPRAMDWIPDAEGAPAVLSIYELEGRSLRLGLGDLRGRGNGANARPEAFSDDFRTITLTKAGDDEEPDAPPESNE